MTGSKRLLLLVEDPSSLFADRERDERRSVEAYCSVLAILCDCFLKCYRGVEGIRVIVAFIYSGEHVLQRGVSWDAVLYSVDMRALGGWH